MPTGRQAVFSHSLLFSVPRIPYTGKTSDNRALRKGRVSIRGQLYLLTFVTQGRRRIFSDFDCACIAARTMAYEQHWLGAGILCWVLMPDHWHGIVELPGSVRLSDCVNRVKAESAYRCNRLMRRRGRLWQKAFHDHALRAEEDLKGVARYVVANPLRAGLVRSVRNYPFWDAVWL